MDPQVDGDVPHAPVVDGPVRLPHAIGPGGGADVLVHEGLQVPPGTLEGGGEEVGAHAPAVRGRAALVVGAPIAGARGRVGAGRDDDVLGVGHTVAVPVTCGPVAFDEVGFGQPVGRGRVRSEGEGPEHPCGDGDHDGAQGDDGPRLAW